MPETLNQHLTHFHGLQGLNQPAVIADTVNQGPQQFEGLENDLALIMVEIVAEISSPHMLKGG